MKNLTATIFLTLAVLIGLTGLNSANAQTVHHVVGVVDYFGDIKIEIVEYFGDEKWEVVGTCSNAPSLKVEIVDYFGDKKIEIVDYFGDKKVCISGANDLDRKTLKLLGLVD